MGFQLDRVVDFQPAPAADCRLAPAADCRLAPAVDSRRVLGVDCQPDLGAVYRQARGADFQQVPAVAFRPGLLADLGSQILLVNRIAAALLFAGASSLRRLFFQVLRGAPIVYEFSHHVFGASLYRHGNIRAQSGFIELGAHGGGGFDMLTANTLIRVVEPNKSN